MKKKSCLWRILGILFLLVSILLIRQSLVISGFEEFYAKFDFHFESFNSYLDSGWEKEDFIENDINLMNVVSKGSESILRFTLPAQEPYLLKIYLGFSSLNQPIDIYLNDNFVTQYTSASLGINSFGCEIDKNVVREGANTLKIVNQKPDFQIMLEQIKIRNYRAKGKDVYVLFDTDSALKRQSIFGNEFFAGLFVIIAITLFLFKAQAVLFKEQTEILADKALKNSLRIFLIVLGPFLIIYLVSFFSRYFILIAPKFYNYYLCFFAAVYIVFNHTIFGCLISKYVVPKTEHVIHKSVILEYIVFKIWKKMAGFLRRLIILGYKIIVLAVKWTILGYGKIIILAAEFILALCVWTTKCMELFSKWTRDNFLKWMPLWLIFLFLTAFLNRYFFYVSQAYLPFECIGTGHDSDYIIQMARAGVFNPNQLLEAMGYWAHPWIIPILSLFFKFFDIYPGAHYFVLTLILLSTFICFAPYIIISKLNKAPSIGGLAAGFLLALHPLLIRETSKIMSDTFGLFVLSVMLVFYYLALTRKTIIYSILLAMAAAFSLYVRYTFLIIAPVVLAIFFLNHEYTFAAVREFFIRKKYKKAVKMLMTSLCPIILFIALAGLFDWYIFKNTGYSIKVKYGYAKFWSIFPETGILKSIFSRDTNVLTHVSFARAFRGISSAVVMHNRIYRNILISFLAMFTVIMLKKPRETLAVFIFGMGYFFIMSSTELFTHLPDRYLLPLIFLFSLMAGFAMEYLSLFFNFLRIKLNERDLVPFKTFLLIPFIFFALYNTAVISKKAVVENQKELEYLKFAAKRLPDNAVLLVDIYADPWRIQKMTNRPVIYNIQQEGHAIYIDKLPYRVKDYTKLADLKEKEDSSALFTLIHKGKRLFIVDPYTLKAIRVLYLKENGYLLNKDKFELKLYNTYNEREICQLVEQGSY